MSTLYLHIGTPKTGTTAIQQFMSQNTQALAARGAIYPALGQKGYLVNLERNGHWLATHKNQTSTSKKEENFNFLEQLSKDYDKIVMSDEGLWNFGGETKEFWEELKRKLSKRHLDLKTIVYLRRQDNFAYSHYSQIIRTSRTFHASIDRYLKKLLKNKLNHADYAAYLDRVADVIGDENVIVRPYEKCQIEKNGNTIIMDFLEHVGVDFGDDFIEAERRSNPSIRDVIIEAKRYINMVPEFAEHDIGISRNLFNAQNVLMAKGKIDNRSGFVKADRQKFLSHFEQGNASVARRFLGREDGVLFYDSAIGEKDERAVFSKREIKRVYTLIQKYDAKRKKPLFEPGVLRAICDSALELYVDANKKKESNTSFMKKAKHFIASRIKA